MSKTRNKSSAKRRSKGAARKSSLSRLGRKFRVGDRVRIIDISEDLKDRQYDSKHPEISDMRSAELFRFCVGRVFRVYGFDRYGNVELHVRNSPAVRKKFGNRWDVIWSEPEFLKIVRKKRKTRRTIS